MKKRTRKEQEKKIKTGKKRRKRNQVQYFFLPHIHKKINKNTDEKRPREYQDQEDLKTRARKGQDDI